MTFLMSAPKFGLLVIWLKLILQACAQRQDGQYWPCNPMKNISCPPNPGLNQYSYYIDFTNPPADMSKDWSTSKYATVTYNTKGKNGAEFTFAKRYDAPQLFTNFYIFFGRVDIEMQVAPGVGIISSGVLISDDFDEIDWEMSGNNFNLDTQFPNGVVQNNYFSKGITGSYDRGQWIPCNKPQTTFHTYSFDWTPTKLDWLIDGKVIRTFLASDSDTTTHQFPQTPSKIQLGLWDGGDPSQNQGTLNWAGGLTNMADAPFTMFVRSVRVTNYNPAQYYNWTDQSGSLKSIKPLNISLPSSTTTSARSTSTTVQLIKTAQENASPKGTSLATTGTGTPTAIQLPSTDLGKTSPQDSSPTTNVKGNPTAVQSSATNQGKAPPTGTSSTTTTKNTPGPIQSPQVDPGKPASPSPTITATAKTNPTPESVQQPKIDEEKPQPPQSPPTINSLKNTPTPALPDLHNVDPGKPASPSPTLATTAKSNPTPGAVQLPKLEFMISFKGPMAPGCNR
ncbi:concanavalin A-like lectin/glucanase domain-containing protein [Whalleya microplaca]|nr:concanavalin A-like lectin/glucanase domain-containing protein [Whalleya microplaca]